MKRLILLFNLFLLSFYGYTQDVYFGVTAGGLNVQSVGENKDPRDKTYGLGLYIGGLADIYINDNLRLQPEMNFGHVSGTNFLHFPLMAKYYLLDYGFNVQAGPQVTFLIGADNGTKDQFGWDLGAGMGVDITKQIFLEGRYTYEISSRKKNYLAKVDDSFKFNSIMIGVGYRFIQ
jgi:opacity protein-like surface antigen